MVRVKCLAQFHNTMSPARTRIQSTCSGVERANHEAIAPPPFIIMINSKHLKYVYEIVVIVFFIQTFVIVFFPKHKVGKEPTVDTLFIKRDYNDA